MVYSAENTKFLNLGMDEKTVRYFLNLFRNITFLYIYSF